MTSIINVSGGIINTFFALIFAVVLVTILWGLVTYFTELGSLEGQAEGKEMILSSVTYLFILMIVYALIEWARGALGI